MWWHVSVVLTIQEAEVGVRLEPRSSRLQGAIITPLYSSLEDKARPYVWEKQRREGCGFAHKKVGLGERLSR